ncbi:MAG: response regulator [Verrucomicrobiota bacterium]
MWNQKPPILIVEDDSNDSFLLQRTLQKIGIRNPVEIVENGLKAIAYLRGDESYSDRTKYPFPGVVITDLKMPLCDGFEVLKWLKNHPECSVIPVIVFSSSAMESDIVKAHRLHANCYLQKPSNADAYTEIVRLLFHFWEKCNIPKLSNSVCAEKNPPDKK